MNQSYIRL